MGIQEIKASVANKLSRGGFSAALFLASIKIIWYSSVRIEDI
jgi:hypothetical protein